MIGRWFRGAPETAAARELYLRIVAQARQPAFYARLGVPDSLDGRFELIVLHVFLVLHRLRRERPAVAQALFDTLFLDLDESLRELGAGDLGVGKRIKRMVQAFYGRVAVYQAGLDDSDGAALEAALRRNLYGTANPDPAQTAAMAGYLRRETANLADQPSGSLFAGCVDFGPPPEV